MALGTKILNKNLLKGVLLSLLPSPQPHLLPMKAFDSQCGICQSKNYSHLTRQGWENGYVQATELAKI